jgi:hypothetical protein
MKLYTCILFCNASTPGGGLIVKKYRNINNLERFKDFAKTINGNYFNVYDKKTKVFIQQIKCN